MCRKKVLLKWVVLLFSLLGGMGAYAQVGGIRGTVMDQDFEVPLPGVKVRISETGQEVETGDGGSYYLDNIQPGSYTLLFSKGGYTRATKPNVVVTPGQLAEADASMAGEYEEMDELVVHTIELGSSEEFQLNIRMESPALMDNIGADMMSQAGASDAAGALKLVSGATVQDGKYAVVRGLPGRYVSSQMNGVRLPTADPDKRAVQLDQFPSAVIESMQVSKTFTPDQQGEASGGAVNLILKAIPDQPILKASVGTKYKTNVNGEDFLTYSDAGLGRLGLERDRHAEQTPGTKWTGALGVEKGDVPAMYDWSLTAGGSKTLFGDVRIGALANAYYKRDASSYDDGIDDKYYWKNKNFGPIPEGFYSYVPGEGWYRDGRSPKNTSLFNVRKSSDEMQWGWLGGLGIENERNKLKLLNLRTHIAEDKATLAEDTRGRDEYAAVADNVPYRRAHTLEYVERDTETLQLSGEHTIPFPDVEIPKVLNLLEPKIDWTVARSSSVLDSPDKRTFGSIWTPATETVEYGYNPSTGGFGYVTNSLPAKYGPDIPSDGVGNLQRYWRKIEEDSKQFFVNGKLPFEQWSGEEGYLKTGLFDDKVNRTFDQRNYSNIPNGSPGAFPQWLGADWSQYWTDNYDPALNPGTNPQWYNIYTSPYGASYEGKQEISAWYWMADVPLTSFFKVVGGTRYEQTTMDISFHADKSTLWYDRENYQATSLRDSPPDPNSSRIDQKDILPSIGVQVTPVEPLTLRANYSQTVARPTFKEKSPIAQQEYAGGDTFIGNPALQMSSLKNYDLRADWTPYPGGLVSVSWFKKDIKDPIEYTQDYQDYFQVFTTAVNYPQGTLSGFEFEVRQHLGEFLPTLNGLSVGANVTLINSEVTLSDEDVGLYYQNPDLRQTTKFGFVETSREMLNAPEHLYNLYTTYDIERFGTKLGLFYTAKGDTLVAGADARGYEYVPSVYAKEYGTLNFTLSKKLGKYLQLSFKAKNLTNPAIQEVYRSKEVQGEALKRSYTKGVEYSVGLSATW